MRIPRRVHPRDLPYWLFPLFAFLGTSGAVLGAFSAVD